MQQNLYHWICYYYLHLLHLNLTEQLASDTQLRKIFNDKHGTVGIMQISAFWRLHWYQSSLVKGGIRQFCSSNFKPSRKAPQSVYSPCRRNRFSWILAVAEVHKILCQSQTEISPIYIFFYPSLPLYVHLCFANLCSSKNQNLQPSKKHG